MQPRNRRWLAIVATALSMWECRRSPAVSFPGAPIILISIDTLRADHLPIYGYRSVDTPAIDSLRADSILFENAYTHAPLTLPAHASLMTGLLPPAHGVRDNLGYRLDGTQHPTLARVLKADSYATGGSVSAYVLRRATGISDGFDFYDDVKTTAADTESAGTVQRPGREALGALLSWIGEHQQDPHLFAFLHLYEPHLPYEPPEPYKSRYPSAYDGEIAEADAVVGELLDALRKDGLYERAIVVLLSDHGEGLGDHGEADHGILLYREVLHVPLLIKLPGGARRGSTETNVVGLVDILPTLCALVGAAAPPGIAGRALISAAPIAEGVVYSETYYPQIHLGWSALQSLVDVQWHLIDGPRPELYDWPRDPGERTDVAGAHESVRGAMQAAIARRKGKLAQPAAADREETERLQALGYLAGGAEPSQRGLNPREEIHVIAEIKDAFRLAAEGKNAAAADALTRLLARNPRQFDVQVKLAETLAALGREDDAIAAYKKAASLSPALAADVALPLARVALRAGRTAEARENAKLALRAQPGPTHELLARAALADDDLAAAEREAQQATGDVRLELNRDVLLAEIDIRRNHLDEAQQRLDAARARQQSAAMAAVPDLEFLRGDVLAREQRYAEAEAAFREEIRAFPANAQAYARLAILYAVQGHPKADVDRLFETMIAAAPTRAAALLAAKTLESLGDAARARAWRERAAHFSR
jgi:choline-sulfatase